MLSPSRIMAAKRVVAEPGALWRARRHERRRGALKALAEEIIDADDRLAIAEREFLAPLDAQAKRAIAGTAKQVSLVTAVSPRAIVDVAFVTFAAVRLLRTIAKIYGGRPASSASCAWRGPPSTTSPSRAASRSATASCSRCWAWARRAHLREARRGRAERPHDGPLRPCGSPSAGRCPSFARTPKIADVAGELLSRAEIQ